MDGRRRRRVPLVGLVALSCLCATVTSAKLLYGPYLQSVAPDRVLVCAAIEEGDRARVRLAGGGIQAEAEAAGTAPACATFSGLGPDAEYKYELFVNGERIAGERQSFVASSAATSTFVILGDTRSGEDSFDLAHRQIVKTIAATTVPDAILHTGDFVERGDSPSLWASFFRIESDLLPGAPLFPAIGQSDQPAGSMRRLFPVLAKAPWYSFDRGKTHFAVLDLWQSAAQPPEETRADGAQARRLREDLAQARAAGAEFIFVVTHEPAIDAEGKSPRAIREAFMPIFAAFRVTAVFSGAHFFSHAVREGVHYFTNGGGGAVLESRPPKEGVFRYFEPVHHFLVLETGPATARLRAVNAAGTDFYSVQFDGTPSGLRGAAAPTFVRTYGDGPRIASLAVFFREGCGDCEQFSEGLPDLAHRVNATLVVTFRSLDDAENRASLKRLTAADGPTPIASVGSEVLMGMEQLGAPLETAILRDLGRQRPTGAGPDRRLVAGLAAAIGLALLMLVVVRWRSRRRRAG